MKIVIPGGSGQIGTLLARAFAGDGHEVTVLSRKPTGVDDWQSVRWNAETLGDWAAEIDGADVLINLAGRSVNCRYNARNREEIKQSRVRSTRVIGEAIARSSRPPRIWLQASTATIYSHRFDAGNDEATGILGGEEKKAPPSWRFSVEVARAWEQAAADAVVPGTRMVLLRSAMTMSPDRGGVFDVLLKLVRGGFGGRAGNGRQYVSWMHDEDFIKAIYWLIERDEIEGPVNLAAPNPLPNAEFMRAIRSAWGIRYGLPAPGWAVKIGALFMKTESELVLKSRRVVPGRLLESGFQFRFPEWPDAVADLCRRWQGLQSSNASPRSP